MSSLQPSFHSHVDELTGLDSNVLVGLKAAAENMHGKLELMGTLTLRAKIDPALKMPPVTIEVCCGKQYVLHYVHQQIIGKVPRRVLTYFTVEEDSANTIYELFVSELSCRVTSFSRTRSKNFIYIWHFPIPDETLTSNSTLATLVKLISVAVNKGDAENRRKLVETLRDGESITITEEGRKYVLTPFRMPALHGRGAYFQVNHTGQLFKLFLAQSEPEGKVHLELAALETAILGTLAN